MPYTASVLNTFLDWIFNQGDPAPIAALWVSLHSGNPSGTGANELSGNGYTRSNATAAFPAASGGALANNVTISFGPATGSNWLEAQYFGLNSASTSGTFYGGFVLDNFQTVQVPNTASFGSGALTASAT